MNYGLRIQTINMQADAALARFEGAYRKAEAAQREYDQSMQSIADEQKGPEAKKRFELLAKLKAQETADVESDYLSRYRSALYAQDPEGMQEAQDRRQRGLAAVEANDIKRRQSQDQQFDFQRKAAFDKLTASMEGMRFEYKLDAFRSLGEIEGANYRMQGMPRQAIISGAQYERDVLIKQENAGRGPYIIKGEGPTADAGREAYQHALGAIDARRDEKLHNFDLDRLEYSFRLRMQNESLSILNARDGGTPAMRSIASSANDIFRETQLDAVEAFRSGNAKDVPNIYKRGAGQETALKQNFLNGLVAYEADPRRTALSGPGTENTSAVFQSIDKALQDLNYKIPSNLPELLRQIGLNGGGALAS